MSLAGKYNRLPLGYPSMMRIPGGKAPATNLPSEDLKRVSGHRFTLLFPVDFSSAVHRGTDAPEGSAGTGAFAVPMEISRVDGLSVGTNLTRQNGDEIQRFLASYLLSNHGSNAASSLTIPYTFTFEQATYKPQMAIFFRANSRLDLFSITGHSKARFGAQLEFYFASIGDQSGSVPSVFSRVVFQTQYLPTPQDSSLKDPSTGRTTHITSTGGSVTLLGVALYYRAYSALISEGNPDVPGNPGYLGTAAFNALPPSITEHLYT